VGATVTTTIIDKTFKTSYQVIRSMVEKPQIADRDFYKQQ